MKRHLLAVPVAVGVLALAAGCGSDKGTETEPASGSPAAGAMLPGGGLSIAEAIASTLEGPLAVKGFLVEVDGDVLLCTTVPESDFEQCGQPSLRVEGYEGDVSSLEQTSLLGAVSDGVITVDMTALAAS